MTPRVSVLIATYNGEAFLAQAIDSVLAQRFDEFELVLIDDASADGTADLIRQYHDPRIRFERNATNLGQAATLNRGLSLCRAPYVARLDQDDACLPDRLRRQADALDRDPSLAVVGTWAYYINAAGQRTGVVGMRVDGRGAFVGALLTFASPFGHPTVMMRRDVVQATGGYDPSFAPCEDYALWCRLAALGHRAVSLPIPLTMLRVHDRQQSRTRAAAQSAQAKRAHRRLIERLVGAGQTQRVSDVLRLDDTFWALCPSADDVRRAVDALDHGLTRVVTTLGLDERDQAALASRIEWWLARGALMGVLQRRAGTWPLYRRALRGGWRRWRYPGMAVYPLCRVLSPVLRPPLRAACLRVASTLGRHRSTWRLRLRGGWSKEPASSVERSASSSDSTDHGLDAVRATLNAQ